MKRAGLNFKNRKRKKKQQIFFFYFSRCCVRESNNEKIDFCFGLFDSLNGFPGLPLPTLQIPNLTQSTMKGVNRLDESASEKEGKIEIEREREKQRASRIQP